MNANTDDTQSSDRRQSSDDDPQTTSFRFNYPHRDEPPIFLPVGVFIGACLLFDLFVIPFVNSVGRTTENPLLFVPIAIGFMMGQIAFAGVFSGFVGTTWLDGFIMGTTLTLLGCLAFSCGVMTVERISLWSEFGPVFFVAPGLLLLLSAPIYLARNFLVWRLERAGHPSPRIPPRISDIFAATITIAAIIALFRLPPVIWDLATGDYYGITSIYAAVLATVGMLVCLPAGYVGFRTRESIGWSFVGLGFVWTILVLFTINLTVQLPATVAVHVIVTFMLAVPIATAVMAVGILTIRAAGYRLKTSRDALPLGERAKTQKVRDSANRRTIRIVAGILAITFLLNVLTAFN